MEYADEIDAIPTLVDWAETLQIPDEDADRYASYHSNLVGANYTADGCMAFANIDYAQLLVDFEDIARYAENIPDQN